MHNHKCIHSLFIHMQLASRMQQRQRLRHRRQQRRSEKEYTAGPRQTLPQSFYIGKALLTSIGLLRSLFLSADFSSSSLCLPLETCFSARLHSTHIALSICSVASKAPNQQLRIRYTVLRNFYIHIHKRTHQHAHTHMDAGNECVCASVWLPYVAVCRCASSSHFSSFSCFVDVNRNGFFFIACVGILCVQYINV